ncbi:hypothetical protein Kisp01_33220 [Kineosporia sp. NBRC 101677]|nr:hypothetical protein Kisp01_33220 [Kineosporia sp. NBRC 101677]
MSDARGFPELTRGCPPFAISLPESGPPLLAVGTESGLREVPISGAMRELLDSIDFGATVRDAMSRLGVLVAQELRTVQVAERLAVRRGDTRSA